MGISRDDELLDRQQKFIDALVKRLDDGVPITKRDISLAKFVAASLNMPVPFLEVAVSKGFDTRIHWASLAGLASESVGNCFGSRNLHAVLQHLLAHTQPVKSVSDGPLPQCNFHRRFFGDQEFSREPISFVFYVLVPVPTAFVVDGGRSRMQQ